MGCGSHTDTVVMRSRRSRTVVEILTAYSHTTHAADLRLCPTVVLTSPVRAARPSAKIPWSLRDRLGEREIAELITAYRHGTTAASLATTHGVSLTSVKRLLRTAGIRRTTPHSTSS
jgi:2,4-dienoyl-CoA reductase-like NADH-dependent reductase (Old Yellow Enzyme family)